MENRFGVKDFFLFVFLSVLIVVLVLGMKQADRQFPLLQSIRDQSEDQMRELTAIHRAVERLQANGFISGQGTTTGPSQMQGPDPFKRVKAAEAMPGYAQGDWLVDSGPNSDKLTPLVSGDLFAADVQGRVLESLLTRDPVTLEWMPLVAQSFHSSEDGLVLTFQIRHNVTFSDGEPLTADDVVWTYQWIMNPKVEAPRDRSVLDKIASVTKSGDYEVVFKFKEPYFDEIGLAGSLNIMPKHFYSKYSAEDFNKSTGLLFGSGQYKMANPTNWSPGQQVELVRNDRYWGEQAAFDKIIYKIIDNDLARLTAFRNGEIDKFGAQPEQYKKLLEDKDIQARANHYEYDTAIGGYRYIAWNEERNGKPTRFADKRIRQAMTMLTDRERICKEVMLGYATPASGPFSPLGKQFNPNVRPWPFDVSKAIALLKQAGYTDDGSGTLKGPDGEPFQFKLTYPSGVANYTQIALFLKDTYAKAGITLIPDPLDWSVFSDRLKNRNFDAISLAWSAGIEDDIYQMFDSSQTADQGDNFMSYKDEKLDKLIEKARTTVDESKRMPLWRECHAILHEDQPYTFLFTRKSLIFIDKRIQNVQTLPLGLNDLSEWYVPKGECRWEK